MGERKRCERGCLREKERYRCAATQTKRYVIRLGCAELCRIEKKGIRISSCRKKGNQDQIDLKGDGMLGLKIEGLGLNPKHTDLKGNEHWFHHGCFYIYMDVHYITLYIHCFQHRCLDWYHQPKPHTLNPKPFHIDVSTLVSSTSCYVYTFIRDV